MSTERSMDYLFPISTQFLLAMDCLGIDDIDRFFPLADGQVCGNCGFAGPCRMLIAAELPEGPEDEVEGSILERIEKYRSTGEKSFLCPSCFLTIWNAFAAILDGDEDEMERWEQEFTRLHASNSGTVN